MAYTAVTTLIKIVEAAEQDHMEPRLLSIFDAGGLMVALLETMELLSAKLCFLQVFLEQCKTKKNDGDTWDKIFLHDAIRDKIASSYYKNEIYKLRRVYLAANVKGYVFEASEELHQTFKQVLRDIEHVEEWILADKRRTALEPEKENITVWDTYQNALVPENEVIIGFITDIETIINRLCYSDLMRSVFTILRNSNIGKFRRYVENLELKLQVIPLVGEGGIGKTTLAKRAYGHPITIASFHIRAWIVVSQVQNFKEMLIGLLHCISPITSEIYNLDDAQIAEQLCRSLMGKKYVILLDDIWTTAAWDAIQGCFPNNYNGSRILVTTRFEEVAKYLSGNPYNVHHQTPEDCMQLFSRKVFGRRHSIPWGYGLLGKRIVSGCGGLPLAVVLIAGLLATTKSLEIWRYVAETLDGVDKNDNNNRISKILLLSYNYLPRHLKDYFHYFGVFPEDNVILVKRFNQLMGCRGIFNAT